MSPTPPPVPEWFVKVIGGIAVAYPAWRCSPETIAVYWAHLFDLSRNELARAVSLHMATSKFAPSIAELRALANGPSASATYVEAWDEMRRNRKLYSPTERNQNHLIRWSSDAVRRAAEAVGWTNMNWLESEMPTIRAQFRMAYESVASKAAEIERHHSIDHIIGEMRGSISLNGRDALYGKSYADDAVPGSEGESSVEDNQ